MTQRRRIGQGAGLVSRAMVVRLAVALAAAAGLSGCAAMSERIAGSASEMPVIGLPASAPERSAAPPAFPAVHDVPPPREAAVLNEVEQRKLENELVAARDAQRGASGSRPKTQKPPPARPAQAAQPVVPVSSSRSIY